MNRPRITFNKFLAFPGCLVVIVGLWALSGCSTIGKIKVDNPVLGPPPPRLGSADAGGEVPSKAPTVTGLNGPASGLKLVGSGSDEIEKVVRESQVVATVNGEPIFAADVLEPYNLGIARAEEAVREGKLPAEVFEKQKQELIKKGLKSQIDRKLLVQGLKKTLKSEQLELIDTFLDQAFQQESEKLQAKFGVTTLHELDLALKESGTSLSGYRNAFEKQMLATEYMRAKRGTPPRLSRDELLQEYQARIKDYTKPTRARWQLLVIDYNKHGGKQGAWAELNKAVQQLKSGVDFTEVVKQYSDSPTKYNGGQWDWTEPGSLSDEKMEQALFELPVGTISQPFVTDTAFKVVKVTEREKSTVVPFEEVQQKIEQAITREKQQASAKKVLDELYETAVIEDIFEYADNIVVKPESVENPFSEKVFQ